MTIGEFLDQYPSAVPLKIADVIADWTGGSQDLPVPIAKTGDQANYGVDILKSTIGGAAFIGVRNGILALRGEKSAQKAVEDSAHTALTTAGRVGSRAALGVLGMSGAMAFGVGFWGRGVLKRVFERGDFAERFAAANTRLRDLIDRLES